MSDFRNLCWGVALASILFAAPALAKGESLSLDGYLASQLMQTAQSDLGVRSALAMGKVAQQTPARETAQALGASYLKALTWNTTRGTLCKGDHVATAMAALAILGMTGPADKDKVAHQADFLLAHQDPDGGIANGFTLKAHKVKADTDPRALVAQTAAIRGWLAAWRSTHDERYRTAARRAYLFIGRSLWSKQAGVYRADERAKQTTYDPYLLGTVIGALRDLAAAHDGAERAEFAQDLDGLWQAVARQGNPLAGVTFATRS